MISLSLLAILPVSFVIIYLVCNSDIDLFVFIFAADMVFNDKTSEVLREEIRELQDTISFQINLISATTKEPVGQAIVELWTLIEHGVNILRQVTFLSLL